MSGETIADEFAKHVAGSEKVRISRKCGMLPEKTFASYLDGVEAFSQAI